MQLSLSRQEINTPKNTGQNHTIPRGTIWQHESEIRQSHKEVHEKIIKHVRTGKLLKSQLIRAANEDGIRSEINKHAVVASASTLELLMHLCKGFVRSI